MRMPRRTFQLQLSSLRWATRCSFGSVSVDQRTSTELSAKRALKNVIDFCLADRNLSSKSLASYFQSKKRNSEVVRQSLKERKKNSSIDLRRAFTSASVNRSSISSASVTAGLFPNLLCFGFFKGELNPEMKLCELLVLGHCIHLPLILFACASSGQS